MYGTKLRAEHLTMAGQLDRYTTVMKNPFVSSDKLFSHAEDLWNLLIQITEHLGGSFFPRLRRQRHTWKTNYHQKSLYGTLCRMMSLSRLLQVLLLQLVLTACFSQTVSAEPEKSPEGTETSEKPPGGSETVSVEPGTGVLNNQSAPLDCLCSGDNVVLQADYVWKDSATYGFDPNITCGGLNDFFATMGCPDAKELREICCIDYNRPRYVCAAAVRDSILSSSYDKLAVPAVSSSFDPIDVTVLMQYQAVTDIDIAAGTVEILVWFTMRWRDERLAWTYDQNTTCTTYPVYARASMGGGSEIWVPEFDLFNRVSGLKSLGDSQASVYPDGTVVWARDGKIKALCSFVNLGQMPFDNLGCQFMFGSVGSKAQFGVRYVLDEQGSLTVGDFSSPYSEYTLASATPGINVSEDTNSEYVFFDFYFQRGTSFYLLNIILPVTIFSTLSILTMILGLNSFQRIALNLTLLLVAVAQKISISRLMPVSDKSIWIVEYVGSSFIWIAVTLFETVLITTIASFRDERKKQKEEAENENENGRRHTWSNVLLGKDSAPSGPATNQKESWIEEDPTASENTEEEEHWIHTFYLRNVDLVCCILSLLSYFIYVIVMFASRDTWGNNQVSNSFLWTNSTAA